MTVDNGNERIDAVVLQQLAHASIDLQRRQCDSDDDDGSDLSDDGTSILVGFVAFADLNGGAETNQQNGMTVFDTPRPRHELRPMILDRSIGNELVMMDPDQRILQSTTRLSKNTLDIFDRPRLSPIVNHFDKTSSDRHLQNIAGDEIAHDLGIGIVQSDRESTRRLECLCVQCATEDVDNGTIEICVFRHVVQLTLTRRQVEVLDRWIHRRQGIANALDIGCDLSQCNISLPLTAAVSMKGHRAHRFDQSKEDRDRRRCSALFQEIGKRMDLLRHLFLRLASRQQRADRHNARR